MSGGRSFDVTLKVVRGTEMSVINAPTRAGYKFTYWKGSVYHPGDKYVVKKSHTFVAQWEKVPNSTDTSNPTNMNLYFTFLISSLGALALTAKKKQEELVLTK